MNSLFQIVFVLFSGCLVFLQFASCEKVGNKPKDPPDEQSVTEADSSKDGANEGRFLGIRSIQNRLPAGFRFSELVKRIGKPLSSADMETLRAKGSTVSIPPTTGAFGEGNAYVIGMEMERGLVVNLTTGNELLAFSYVLPASDRDSDDGDIEILKEFQATEPLVQDVLDDQFQASKLVAKTYTLNAQPLIGAVAYQHFNARTISIFDSSRITARDLLPSSADAIDPAVLEQLRASLRKPIKR